MKALKSVLVLSLIICFLFAVGCQRTPEPPVNPANTPAVSPSATAAASPEPEPTKEASATPVPDETTPLPDADPAQIKQLVSGNGRFATDLYKKLSQKEGNIFFSPYSISTALSMTYMGAAGNTEAQMKMVLYFDLNQEKLPAVFSSLSRIIEQKKDKDGSVLSVANRIWVQKDFVFLDAFTDACRKYYGAPQESVNFKDPEPAREEINKWVAEQTQDKIKDLIPKGVITELTRMVLTNAVYFKGTWVVKFDKKNTSKEAFHTGPGASMQVDMMHRTGDILYSRLPESSAVLLPYTGEKISMMIILPDKVDGIKELDKKIDFGMIDGLVRTMQPANVRLSMPVFKAEMGFSLKKTLEEMGMIVPFSDLADFSKMEPSKSLKITDVIHKAFVSVDESGTEAAAATAVVMGLKESAERPVRIIDFKVDRPFVFIIRENSTGSILFMGRITNPQK